MRDLIFKYSNTAKINSKLKIYILMTTFIMDLIKERRVAMESRENVLVVPEFLLIVQLDP